MEIDGKDAYRLLGDLLPKTLPGASDQQKWKKRREKYRNDSRIQDDLIWHLKMARDAYDAAKLDDDQPHPRVADKRREVAPAIAAIEHLRSALTNPGTVARIAATAPANVSEDYFHQYVALLAPSAEYRESVQEILPLLNRIQKLLVQSQARVPNATPKRALRCAVAPLIALFREHNPDAKLVKFRNTPNRATVFVLEALTAVGIEASDSTVSKFELDDLPYCDWYDPHQPIV